MSRSAGTGGQWFLVMRIVGHSCVMLKMLFITLQIIVRF